MSQVNIQNLLKLGKNTPLGAVSPGSPSFRQSSFQGGQVQVGSPTQQIGPTSEEAMYASLSEIAGGVQQGINNFTEIQGRIEKNRIESARQKYKEIFTKDYVESLDDPTTKTGGYLKPEDKLNEWNSYIKEIWTPLSGSTWIDEINTEAYNAFGSREAQDKFEKERYERESYLFFSDPKNTPSMNQNSPVAKMEFDAFYLSKYPTADGNYWFRSKKQENVSLFQMQEDSLAKQSLEESLSEIVQVPPLEIAKAVAESNSDAAVEMQDRYAVFYKEILPSIPQGASQREVAGILIRFYNKHLIEDNPKEYQPHTLLELQRAIPQIAMQHARSIMDVRSITNITERKSAAEQSLNVANNRLSDPTLWDESKTNFFKSVVRYGPFSGTSSVEQTNAIAAASGAIWKQGYDSSQQFLKTKVTRRGGTVPLVSTLYDEFPTLNRYKTGESSNLGSLSPNQQVETIAGFILEEALTDPATANSLMTLYNVDNIPDAIKAYRVSVNAYILSSKEISDANNLFYREQDIQTQQVMSIMEQHSDLNTMQQHVSSAIESRAARNNLPLDLFRSIYVTSLETGEDYKGDFNLDAWYISLSPQDRKRVDDAYILYGSNKQQLQESARQAFALELKAIDLAKRVSTRIDALNEDQQKALDKEFQDRQKAAIEANNQLSRFNVNINDPIAAVEKGGDIGLAYITGDIYATGAESEKANTIIVSHYRAFKELANIPRLPDGSADVAKLSPTQKSSLDLLSQLVQWENSEIPEEKILAQKVKDSVFGLQTTINEARVIMGKEWVNLQRSQHELRTPNQPFDLKKATEQFDSSFSSFENDILAGKFSFNGQFNSQFALNPDGSLSQYTFNWLASAYTFSYRAARSTDQRVVGTQHNEQLRTITENLVNGITVNNSPDDFQKNPTSILPYLGFLMYGKGLNRATQERGLLPAASGAGWFVDRVAMIANASSSLDIADASNYFSSAEFRKQSSYISAFPFVMSSWMRDSANKVGQLFVRTATSGDQLNQADIVSSSPIIFARNAINQSDLASYGISDPDKLKDRSIDVIKTDPESIKAQLDTIISGKTISPNDPAWNPYLAYVLWQKAGLVPEGMSYDNFAMDLSTRLLEGSIDPTQPMNSDTRIRLAFSALEELETVQDKGFTNVVSMALDPKIGIGTSNFPLSTGANVTTEFLGFLGAALGVNAAYETGALVNNEVTIGYNDNIGNKTFVQTSPTRMTHMYSMVGPTLDQSYSVSSLTGFLYSNTRNPLEFTNVRWEQNPRFKPERSIINNKPEENNGVTFKAGTLLLESKPNSDNIKTMIQPYIEHLFQTEVMNVRPGLRTLLGQFVQESLEQPTTFDALVDLNTKLLEADLPGFIRPSNLYTQDNKVLPGASTIVQLRDMSRANSMGFTYSWINQNFNGTPMIHLPDSVWQKPLEFRTNKAKDTYLEKEKIRKEIELKNEMERFNFAL